MADYRFNYKVIASDREGYYFDRWDRAVPVAVVAPDKKAALEQVWAIQGEAPRGRFWKARLLSVEPAGLIGGEDE